MVPARQAYDQFEAQVRHRYPNVPLGWGFTAHKVRRKLADQGLPHDCVAVSLSRMHDLGVTHLAVQSLHTIPGVEYFWTQNLAKAYEHPRKGFIQVAMGAPLLSDQEDLRLVVDCLREFIPRERRPDEAVILAGHGTYHDGQKRYLDLQHQLQNRDPLLHTALLMGQPNLAAIVEKLRDRQISTVWLLPFMAVAGHHVQKDMFGPQPGSWSNRLRAAGFQVREHAAGTIESGCFRSIWMKHLGMAMSALGPPHQDRRPHCSQGTHHAHH
ncbi:sirohydrochlorin cobaltochelatase [Desulfonatronum thioautotrophicum]|uniref:sirohydrochlorin cobaltochelatase n=1 Tax=Desulfonatronum thioautotrophicum TaxID=617001 RepID=UPI00069A4DE3|nr:sirohydrochlorin cobaltochelatase [Desulfonatronum thioautotrophicum]